MPYFGAILSNCENRPCLASIFSTIASITKSVCFAPSSNEVVDDIRPKTSEINLSPAFKKLYYLSNMSECEETKMYTFGSFSYAFLATRFKLA